MMLKAVILSMRLPFLVLTPICVFLGACVAWYGGGDLQAVRLTLAMLGALCAHASVNLLNEYLDFDNGLDLRTVKTPFSGGSGALPDNPMAKRAVLGAGVLTFLFAGGVGVYFLMVHGLALLPLGVVGLSLILAYTRWINRQPWLCLIAPGIGFGLLMVPGSQFVVEGRFDSNVWWVASVPFFLMNNLLLLNQFPDKEADQSVGRNHFPIAYGFKASIIMYSVFLLAAVVMIFLSVFFVGLPAAVLMALLPFPLAVYALYGAIKWKQAIGDHPPFLAANVAAALLSPLLFGVGLLLGR